MIVEKFIKNLSGKLNIHIVGDNMKNDEIVNHGLINKDKVLEILKKTNLLFYQQKILARYLLEIVLK